jgi:thiosulfate/3-mercaptopyruvate sulfurtransferase
MYKTIIGVGSVKENLNHPDWVIVDCRFDLSDKDAGKKSYLEAHIPGAVFADLHDDLSGPPITDHGRHPLPSVKHLKKLFEHLGISNQSQVITYDNVSGSFAARLWWLLHYMGHENVAVVDGGWALWLQAGFQIHSGKEKNPPGKFQGQVRTDWLITADMVPTVSLLVDSRDPARYRGELEPIDRIAGHIPGAINHFWKDNLTAAGLFKDNASLRKEFLEFLDGVNPGDAVFYCGSGVTACHNLLAAACAGLPPSGLYAGSWSDWCSDSGRPVVTGDIPGSFGD